MTKYNFIKNLKSKNVLETAIKSGLLASKLPYMIYCYETYLKIKHKEKMVRYSETAEIIGRNEFYVMRVVSFMETKI